MPTIFDYIATMDAAAVDNPTGDGFGVLPLPTGTGTATSGVVGVATLPALSGDGTADWAAYGAADLPALTGDGTTDGYHPAWGDAFLPALTGDGTAHVLIESVGLLPPLFGMAYCGATAEAALPAMTSSALSGYNVTAAGAGTIPGLTSVAYSCGLDKPIDTGATSAAVVNLLQQGNPTLADAAASICAYDDTDDERAISLVYFVSNLMAYVQDGNGIGDRWTCALATWWRKYGDCEDGAVLIHALLLAAGVDPARVQTAFGTALTTDLVASGHAWVMYRRLTDEEWIPLDWTFQPSPYDVEVWQINRQVDMTAAYTKISYILTHEAFYAVNDANYIPKLAANRSTGSGTLPPLAGDAAAGPHAKGTTSLSALAGTGLCGAVAAAKLPALAGTGTAQQLTTAWGAATLATMAGDGTTGATAAGVLAAFTGTGQCGTSASGKANFPAITGDGTATTAALVHGVGILPAFTGAGIALPGAIVAGTGLFPAMFCSGRAKQGPVAQGMANLPRLAGTGHAAVLLAAVAAAELPPFVGQGHAIGAAPWVRTLKYDPARWA